MSEQQYHEKSEKDEKERDKQDEKTVEEKYRRDPLSAILWGAILIWAGLVFLADNLGMLGTLFRTPWLPGVTPFIQGGAWSLIFMGAGGIILIGVAIRLLVPEYRRPVGGDIILAAIFIAIGLGNLVGWQLVWPLILIAIGLNILFGRARRRP